MPAVRRTLRSLRPALAALAAAWAAACADSTLMDAGAAVPEAPAPYVLDSINGQPLPMLMRSTSSGQTVVTRGELLLGGNTFWQRITLSDISPAGVATARESVTEGTITVTSGGRIHFRSSTGSEWNGTARPGWIFYSFPGNNGPVSFAFRRE